MNMRDQIAQWANRMWYKGNIPAEFRCVCNQKTEIIWCQIVSQLQPKQEVEYVRRILLFHHLNKLQSKRNVRVDVPMRELEVWKKKMELEKEMKALNSEIMLSEQKGDQLHKMNNQSYIRTENIQRNIQEHEEKEYLLERLQEKLDEEIVSLKEMLDYCVRLTPVEGGDNRSVLDDLNKVAEKLKSLILSHKENEKSSCFLNVNDGPVTPKIKNALIEFHECQMMSEEDVVGFIENGPVEQVSAILRKYNRLEMWHKLRWVEDGLEHKSRLFSHTLIKKKEVQSNMKHTKLYALHITKALETIKYKNRADCLQKKIEKVEYDINSKFSVNKYGEEASHRIKAFVQSGKEEAGFNAALSTLKIEYKAINKMCGSTTQLQLMMGKKREMETSFQTHIQDFIQKYGLLMQVHRFINAHREESVFTVRKLNRFIDDYCWIEPLSDDVISDGVLALRDFSLDHNKQFTYSNNAEEKYLRDCIPHTIPFIEDMNEEMVTELGLLFETPFYSPGRILRNFSEKRVRLEKLRSLEKLPGLRVAETNYSAEQFAKQELKLDNAIEKIMFLIRNDNQARKYLSMSQFQEIMDLWLNMPMGNVMLPSRLLDLKPYQYYEDLFEVYYKQL